MDKQPAKTTGQQDTNAALAALAAAGNTFALGQLWEINKGLLHRLFLAVVCQEQSCCR